MTDFELLKEEMRVCEAHEQRLVMALGHVKQMRPITPDKIKKLSDEELGYLEVMSNRFGKLQDTMGKKLFPLVVSLSHADDSAQSFIDILNALEKAHFLDSVLEWTDLRVMRNTLAHEYPDNPVWISKTIEACFLKSASLLACWRHMRDAIERDIFPLYTYE